MRWAIKKGCASKNGQVKVLECFHCAYNFLLKGSGHSSLRIRNGAARGCRKYIRGGRRDLIAATGLWRITPAWVTAPGKCIEIFGTESKKTYLKRTFISPMGWYHAVYRAHGRWDVGALTTMPSRIEGHSFHQRKQIFITNGEYDLAEKLFTWFWHELKVIRWGPKAFRDFLVSQNLG